MPSLLSTQQFQDINNVLNDVTDTFMNTPIILLYQLHNNEDTFGVIGAAQYRWLTIPVYALVNSGKSEDVTVDEGGRSGNTVRKYTVATKDYNQALQTAVAAYNTAPVDGILAPVPVIQKGIPINYVDSTRLMVVEAPWGQMRAKKLLPKAVWGPKDQQQHKLICIEVEEQPYVKPT